MAENHQNTRQRFTEILKIIVLAGLQIVTDDAKVCFFKQIMLTKKDDNKTFVTFRIFLKCQKVEKCEYQKISCDVVVVST